VRGEPAAAGPRVLNDLQASLVELAGAVRMSRQPRAAEAFGPAPSGVPPFVPDPEFHAAVEAGVLPAGSPVDQAIAEVVGDFTREGS
jgi:hypothetical protein